MDDENLLVSLVDERLVASHLIVRLKIQRPDRSNRIVSECLIKPWLNRPLSHPAQIHSTRLRRATIPRKFPTKFQRVFAFFISLEEEMTNDGIIASKRERERARKKRGGVNPLTLRNATGETTTWLSPSWEILCRPIVQFHVSFLKLHDRSSILFVDHVRLRSTDHSFSPSLRPFPLEMDSK